MRHVKLDRRQFALGLGGGAVTLAAQARSQPLALAPETGVRNGFRPVRFGQVHYRYVEPVRASGKLPLICLHASPTSGITYLDFLPLIGADRLAIAPDTPGYGLSDRPPARSTIADFAAAMGDLLDALHIRRIDLLGNHTSTGTALELARQRPGLVRRIVLNSALMYTPEEREQFIAASQRTVVTDIDVAAAKIPELWASFRKFRRDLKDEQAWRMFWELNRDPTHANWGYLASYEYDFATTLSGLKQPILILNLKDVLFEITARARDIASNVKVVDVPWTGGTFNVNAPRTAQIVRAFLDR